MEDKMIRKYPHNHKIDIKPSLDQTLVQKNIGTLLVLKTTNQDKIKVTKFISHVNVFIKPHNFTLKNFI